MSLKVSMILELVNRFSGNARKARADAEKLAGKSGLGGIGAGASSASRGMDRVGASSGRLRGRIASITASAQALGRRALPAISAGAQKAAYGVGLLIGKTIRLTAQMGLAAVKWGALGAVAAGGVFARGVIATASQFEQFQVILENTEGSAAKAQAAMDWVRKFAASTPYELADVMDAFVKLKSYGIEPTNGALEALGNMAAGMGKDLGQAVEMLADAQTGEFERLKEFGIKASQAGGKVTLTYFKAGKEVKKTGIALKDVGTAITTIANDKFGGMMARQSQTLAGIWSNLKDQVSGFMLLIGNGVAPQLKAKLNELLAWANKVAADGRLKKWADDIAGKMNELVEEASTFVEQTDWNAVVSGLKSIGSTIVWVIGLIGQAAAAYGSWANDVEMRGLDIKINGSFTPENEKESARQQLWNLQNGRPRDQGVGKQLKRSWGDWFLGRDPRAPMPAKPRAPNSDFMRPGGGPRRPALPGLGKPLAFNNELHVRISTAPGVEATAKPGRLAANTRMTTSRDYRQPAMGVAA